MAEPGENVAESTLAYDQFRLDPGLRTDDGAEPSPVWAESQRLRELVDGRKLRPSTGDRDLLAQAVRDQVRTLDLYTVADELAVEAVGTRNPRRVTLYALLFPGQARDNTGIKDLNDKVLGYTRNSQFMDRRRKRIASIFSAPDGTDGPRYATVGQDYKTAYVLAVQKDAKDFAKQLTTLDAGLREDLIAVLELALTDTSEEMKKKRPEIQKLLRTLKRDPKYRFDFLFGSDTLTADDAAVDLTFQLITEALKAAGIARYAVKLGQIKAPAARRLLPRPPAAGRGEDDRGQPFQLVPFLRLAKVAQDLKKTATAGPVAGQPVDYLNAYVNTVWTIAFLLIDRLFYANPSVMRDVRKKALVKPPGRDGLKIALEIQIQVLETWIVAVNLIDFASGFLSEEFPNRVDGLHVQARTAVRNLTHPDQDVDWDHLIPVLTRDVRLSQPVAQQGTPSQFPFYSGVSDFPDQIFLTMDIRDLGVELMNYYEIVTEFIVFRQLGGAKLLEQTLRSNDGTLQRKRFTYDRILAVFFRHYQDLRGRPGPSAAAAGIAFGRPVSGPLPSFEKSVRVMIGGDEFFVGAHPLYTERITEIIAELDRTFLDPAQGDVRLNMRAGVAFSSSVGSQRPERFAAHERAMKLSGDAPNMLKQFERQHDRIERLIGLLESNPKKKDKAPGFRSGLADIGLLRVYARAKFMHASVYSPAAYARLRQALKNEDLSAAVKTGEFDLIDFDGAEVKAPELTQRADDLEKKVRDAVGRDNFHVDPPPTLLLTKEADNALRTVEKIIDKLQDFPPKVR
ncbi:hypothetical protein ACIA5C_10450 [Actinoplanes sp. NPDC051343]|uniref:hypothetical protein n=1 Tax=Actinoplanes sp. NPDC051343 TaxID=3363906 RepID=UPI0037A19C61